MVQVLPIAPDQYERRNEADLRRTLEDRLDDLEGKANRINTQAGTLRFTEGDITLVNGDNDDVAPGFATYIRIGGPSAAFTTSGFTDGESGRVLHVRNTVAFDWTIEDQNAGSSAANRILTMTGADVVLTGISLASFVYDSSAQLWILLGTQG
jgi:hypothetical protein